MNSRYIFGLSLLFMAFIAGILTLTWLNGSGVSTSEIVPTGMIALIASVGMLIVSRRTRNPIGWILVWIAASMALYGFSSAYARYALITRPGSLPLGLVFAWVTNWNWILYVGPVVIYLPLLFPTGRLLSPRWKVVARPAGGYLVGVALLNAIRPGPLEDFEYIRNPLGLEAAVDKFEFFETLATLPLVFLALLSVSSLLIRYARSRGDERAQLKWFFYVAALFLLYVVYGIISDLGFLPSLPEELSTYVFFSFLVLLALAIGIAVLKYRLYDIDLIIRKTLVYAALTGLLALVYFGGVTLLGSLLSSVSQQRSAIAIVITTLAIAALFNPLRRRIQEFIDRRFFRKKYDAEKILDGFARVTRDEVDLEVISGELTQVVRETVQPAKISIWLSSERMGKI